jgi:transcriptional regulator with PAS, ATPase and Fis domain
MIHNRLENLVEEMLEGQILLEEAMSEFEKLYIKKALARHKQHLSKTAAAIGIHRNTLAKRVAAYHQHEKTNSRSLRKAAGKR